MFKRITSFLLVTALLVLMSSSAFAVDNTVVVSQISADDAAVLSESLEGIPIFITELNISDPTERAQYQTNIDNTISVEVQNRTSLSSFSSATSASSSQSNEPISLVTNAYTVTEIPSESLVNLLTDPTYSSALMYLVTLAESGANIDYINLYTKENFYFSNGSMSTLSTTSNADSEEYWESNFDYLGTYEGYKFLYSEISAPFSYDEVEPGNLSSAFNWGNFLLSDLTSAATFCLAGQSITANIFSGLILAMFDSISTPLSVTFAQATDSIVRAWSQGVLYIRTIYIQDLLDRASGYAYYPWGTTQQAEIYFGIRAIYPVSQRTSSSYNYESAVGQSEKITVATPRFTPGSLLYSKILEYYELTTGYYTYSEIIDLNTIVYSILS